MRKLIIYLILLSEIFSIQILKPSSINQLIQKAKEPIFIAQAIPNDIYEKMLGKSIPKESKDDVDISKLSYLQISYYGFDGKIHVGEMIVNAKVADDVLDIFKELYNIKYPIEKIKLIDEYDANDEASMTDNNTSCFCYRVISRYN